MARAVLLTGGLGSGKTTVAAEIGELLGEAGVPHAVVDLDWLCWVDAPGVDVHRMLAANLRALWRNYAEAGVTRLVMARALLEPGHLTAVRRGLGVGRDDDLGGGLDGGLSSGMGHDFGGGLGHDLGGGLGGETELSVVRLTASAETIRRRLQGRDSGAVQEGHLREAADFERRIEQAALHDVVVTNDGAPVRAVAERVLKAVGW